MRLISSPVILLFFILVPLGCAVGSKDNMKKEVYIVRKGAISSTVNATGFVEPQNRVEIRPSIAGRIEDVSVNEGDFVKKGQVLAVISSNERAALLDAAILKGDEEYNYWGKVYKPIPVLSPIDGQVIARNFEPGQTISTADTLLVLSDKLVITAQFDETDIGKVAVGQDAIVVLDAYPMNAIKGKVSHISYEAATVNNVTMYDVKILPEKMPDVVRSGMNAAVDIVIARREGVLILEKEAVQDADGKRFVFITGDGGQDNRVSIQTGLESGDLVEVVSGLREGDKVVVYSKSYLDGNEKHVSSPFLPNFNRNKKR